MSNTRGKRIIQCDELLVSALVSFGFDLLLKFRCREVIFKGRERGLDFAAYISTPHNLNAMLKLTPQGQDQVCPESQARVWMNAVIAEKSCFLMKTNQLSLL